MRKSIFLFVCSFSTHFFANAQENTAQNAVTISSPTAASLGKYGDFPVSYHTGTPQI